MRKIMTGINEVLALGEPGRGGATQEYLVQAGSKPFELTFMSDASHALSKDGMKELTKLLEASDGI